MERNKLINIRVSEEEYSRLKTSAENVGMSVSEYVRDSAGEIKPVLYDPEIRESIFDALSLLRQMGTMVHEMGKDTSQEAYLKDLNIRLSFLIDGLLASVKGAANGDH